MQTRRPILEELPNPWLVLGDVVASDQLVGGKQKRKEIQKESQPHFVVVFFFSVFLGANPCGWRKSCTS